MKVYINPEKNYYYPIVFVLKIIEKNKNIKFDFTQNEYDADLIWNESNINSEIIALDFFDKIENKRTLLDHELIFIKEPVILNSNGHKDFFATIFYLVNCLQEFHLEETKKDKFGRFNYDFSYQAKFEVIEQNLVQNEIDSFCKLKNINGTINKSNFFISHDIDLIYGSLLQDGFWAAKNFKINVLLKIIFNEVLKKPDWKNIHSILKLHSEYDIRSTFFWIVNKGVGTSNIMNADYDLRKESALLQLVAKSGSTNGLHKSCSPNSINEELEKTTNCEYFNRYHFLNFQVNKDWKKIADSKLEFDSSLGFAEHYGFRNSYGKSFQPFDIINNKPFDFVETPLNFMDVTMHKYMKIPKENIADIVISFYEKNKFNCDISLLWHNNYFTNYKYNGFLEVYKKIILYLYENKIETLSPRDLIGQNKLTW